MKNFTTRHDGFPPLLVAQGSSRGAAAQSDTPATTPRRLLALFEAVFPMLNPFARIPVCGLISMYNATAMSLCGEEDYCQCDYFYGEGAHRVKFISIRPLSVSNQRKSHLR